MADIDEKILNGLVSYGNSNEHTPQQRSDVHAAHSYQQQLTNSGNGAIMPESAVASSSSGTSSSSCSNDILLNVNLNNLLSNTNKEDENIEGTYIKLVIHHGYSFRGLIEYLRETNTNGQFRFDKEGMTYRQANANGTLFNDIEIFGFELPEYIFRSNEECWYLRFKPGDLREHTNKTPKKAETIIEKPTNSNYINICINKGTSGDGGGNTIFQPLSEDLMVLTADDSPFGPEHEPICTERVSDMVNMCTTMKRLAEKVVISKIGPRTLEFIGYNNLNQMVVYRSLGHNAKNQSYTNTTNSNNLGAAPALQIVTNNGIILPANMMGMFAKLSLIAEKACVKFYMGEENGNKLLKLVTNIQHYGFLRIYLRDQSNT